MQTLRKHKWIYIVILIHLAIGIIYSGSLFFKNMSDSLPVSSVGDSEVYMAPGDQFEQFYRYSLVHNNLLRDNSPYFSGYQYNFSENDNNFTEGLVFFPFSLISALISIVTGDIFAYNLMALLSYVFVGISVFLLIKMITRNIGAAIITSVFYTALPFRTSFLYGEMVFAVDLCLLAIPILLVEKILESKKKVYFIALIVSLFFILMANLQLFYYYMMFTSPYFAIRLWMYIREEPVFDRKKVFNLSILVVGLGLLAMYTYNFFTLMSKSGLSNGQDYSELFVYAPDLINMFTKFSGNEKNLYLGWTLLVFMCFLLFGIWNNSKYLDKKQRLLLFIFVPLFIGSYVLTLGPNIDKHLGLPIYRGIFEYIPGANGTRTTGRIMSVAGFYFTIVLGLLIHWMHNFLRNKKVYKKAIMYVSVALICIAIVVDFHYLAPSMSKVEQQNDAYDFINGTEYRVLGIPFQLEADHYFNATYMYYALKYDLRMFNGHSSLFPSSYVELASKLYPINEGDIDKDIWETLKKRNYKYITVHNTNFQPGVPRIYVAKLINSNYLRLLKEDNGVYLLEVLDEPKGNMTNQGFNELYNVYSKLGIETNDIGNVNYFTGWYSREVYPDQMPFRWTRGTKSSLAYLIDNNKPISNIEFYVKAPLVDQSLSVYLNGVEYITEPKIGNGEWNLVSINLSTIEDPYYYIEIETNHSFIPEGNDTRDLGLMITDVQTK